MERILSPLSNVFCNRQEKPQRVLVAGGTSFSPVLTVAGFKAKFTVAESDGQIG
jgi:hypothetical protein